MKRKLLHFAGGYSPLVPITIFVVIVTTFSASAVSAQTVVEADVTASITVDAYTNQGWKSVDAYTAIVAAERIVAAEQLSKSNLSDREVALYTSYDRMLGYMQADLAVKAPIENIAEINFKKVLQEAPTDPVLTHLQESEFTNLYGSLIVKLVLQ